MNTRTLKVIKERERLKGKSICTARQNVLECVGPGRGCIWLEHWVVEWKKQVSKAEGINRVQRKRALGTMLRSFSCIPKTEVALFLLWHVYFIPRQPGCEGKDAI